MSDPIGFGDIVEALRTGQVDMPAAQHVPVEVAVLGETLHHIGWSGCAPGHDRINAPVQWRPLSEIARTGCGSCAAAYADGSGICAPVAAAVTTVARVRLLLNRLDGTRGPLTTVDRIQALLLDLPQYLDMADNVAAVTAAACRAELHRAEKDLSRCLNTPAYQKLLYWYTVEMSVPAALVDLVEVDESSTAITVHDGFEYLPQVRVLLAAYLRRQVGRAALLICPRFVADVFVRHYSQVTTTTLLGADDDSVDTAVQLWDPGNAELVCVRRCLRIAGQLR